MESQRAAAAARAVSRLRRTQRTFARERSDADSARTSYAIGGVCHVSLAIWHACVCGTRARVSRCSALEAAFTHTLGQHTRSRTQFAAYSNSPMPSYITHTDVCAHAHTHNTHTYPPARGLWRTQSQEASANLKILQHQSDSLTYVSNQTSRIVDVRSTLGTCPWLCALFCQDSCPEVGLSVCFSCHLPLSFVTPCVLNSYLGTDG